MSARQTDGEGPQWYSDGKNLVIAVLAIVALVQGFLLFKDSPPPDLTPTAARQAPAPETPPAAPTPASVPTPEPVAAPLAEQPATETVQAPGQVLVKVSAVTLEADRRRYVLISFDQPLGEGQVGTLPDKNPGSFYPELYGSWSWISPFTLRFDFEKPLPPGNEYYLNLDTNVLVPPVYKLEGDSNFTVRTTDFQVNELTLNEDLAPGEPGKVVLKGQLELSYPVEPDVLMRHLRLLDPLRGEQAPVPLRLDTAYRSRWLEFQSAPLEKKDEPRTLTLRLGAGLKDAESDLTLGEDVTEEYELRLDPDLVVRTLSAQSALSQATVTLSLSAPVDARNAGPYVQVQPQAVFTLAGSGRDLLLNGDFTPGREYVVTLKQGLTAADGAVLPEEYSESVVVPDLEPTVAFRDKGIFLPASGAGNLAVQSVNTPLAALNIDRVYTNNLFALLHDYSTGSLFDTEGYPYALRHYLGDRVLETRVDLPAPKNQVRQLTLDMQQHLQKHGPGFYRVFLGLPDAWQGDQRWVLVTDLGLVAKKSGDDVLVWVNSFNDLTPVAGVRLTLLSDQNQVLAQGETDAQGLWQAKDLGEAFSSQTPFMVLAEKDNDFSFLLFDQFKIDGSGQDIGGERVPQKGYLAYLYGERDIYRPGETLQAVALLRQADLGTPPAMPLTLIQRDPQGKELSRRVAQSDARGVATLSYEIPSFALTGNYTLEALAGDTVVGSYRYKVEEFMPDRIKVEIAPEKASFSPGEELRYRVASRYFFGPPASELAVESRVVLMAAPFAPQGWEAWQFGNPEGDFDPRELVASGPDEHLDGEGERSFSVTLPEDLRPPAALEAMVFARVRERGGRGVGAMQRVLLHPYQRYVGLKKLDAQGVEPRAKVAVEYAVLDAQGKEATGAPLRLDFYLDRWQTVLRSTPSGGIRYESVRDSRLLSSQSLEQAAARGSLAVVPPDYGSYRVVLTDEEGGALSQVSFYAGGWGYSPWAIENPAKLEIVADKEEYAPGDTASLQIRTPFAGKLLVTVEGSQVFDTRVLTLEEGQNTAQVTLPMDAAYSPNVYVSGVLVRSAKDSGGGAPARAYGATPVYVDRTANRMQVQLSAPEQIRPETTLEVGIQSEPGSVVTLAAVDEGILQLIAQQTPDPFARFYAKRSLDTESFDIYSMLFPDVPATEGTALVGGDMGLDRLRQFVRSEGLRRVKPVAFWTGPLDLDAEGKAVVRLDIPEFQGALRLMAVVNHGRRFGSNHALTRVRTPVVVTPTLPRFLSPGDTVQIPVTVRNDTPQDGSFTLHMHVTGQDAVVQDETMLQVPQGRETLHYFSLTVAPGTQGLQFRFWTEGNNETSETGVDVPVRPALPPRTLVQAGSLEQAETVLPLQGEGYAPQGLTREVQVGGLPLLRYVGSLEELLGYPYGCLEQTVSRAFPLAYFESLAAALGQDSLGDRQPAAMVQSGIQRLLTMQLGNGGFGMWPGDDRPYAWGSIYAAHFLSEAKNAGFLVPDSVLNLALDYLTTLLQWSDEPKRADLERMAYAHFVLAKAGRPDRGGLDFLAKRWTGKLTAEAATLIGGAYGLLGDTKTMDKLLGTPVAEETSSRETGGNLNSPIRNTAMRLTVLLDTQPTAALVPKLVQRLTSLLDATPARSTQENGLAFVALGRFFHTQAKKPPCSGAVYLGDELVGRFSSESPLRKTGLLGAAPLRVVLDKTEGQGKPCEPGSVFYSVLTRGTPTPEAFSAENRGLEVEREYLDREGKPLPPDGVLQGSLVLLKTSIRSQEGAVDNVVLQALLPAGLEVENPRLENTERLPWAENLGKTPDHQDLRDDRVLLFLSLPDPGAEGQVEQGRQVYYSLLRAVTPGEFGLPPLQAEAMYDPSLLAVGEPGRLTVRTEQAGAVAPAAQ